MAKKPSERRNFKEEEMELNITPMMNLIAILIPALLVSTSFVEIAILEVAAPAIGSSSPNDEQRPPDKPPLNLKITVTDAGYKLETSGAVIGRDGREAPPGFPGPTIPIVQKTVSCNRYVDTVPPPRSKNSGICDDEQDARSFYVYDTNKLAKMLAKIKVKHPDERRVIIAAEPDIEFEVITDIIDASRQIPDPGGTAQELFPEVVLSPGVT